MRYRKLGSSDLEVSELAFGSWLTTYTDGADLDAVRSSVDAAFDEGITFFDTANMYGRGAAERVLGNLLSTHPRDSFVLATKVHGQMSDDPADRGLSAPHIAKEIDASLARLQVDHVDLYQAHRFDTEVPIEETLEAFARVVETGKARYVGFSEWTPTQIQAAIDLVGPDFFVSSQPQYSMLWRGPEEEAFPLSAANGISQIVWSPLAQGVLTGKYLPDAPPPPGSRAGTEATARMIARNLDVDVLRAVQRLVPIAEGAGLTLPQLALAWVLRRNEVAAAIIGASRPEQVRQNVAAVGVDLTQDVLEAVDVALGDVVVRERRLGPGAFDGVLHRDDDRVLEGQGGSAA